jgi:hypothetical protein
MRRLSLLRRVLDPVPGEAKLDLADAMRPATAGTDPADGIYPTLRMSEGKVDPAWPYQ